MTDETSRQGYDDVLSSVRRIVASEAEAAAEAETGKLLLTPSLRVTGPEGRTDAAPTPGPAGERDFPTLEERIAELEAAVSSEPVEWEPDGSEDQAEHAPQAVVLPMNPASRRNGADRTERQTNEDDLVFAVAGESGEDNEGEEEPGVNREATATRAGAPAEEAAPSDERDGRPAKPTEEPTRSTPPMATFRHRGQLPEPPPDRLLDDDEPALLDEGALRELVAEIVREELQGGLGERITRNVRKLVRAEIQRAFAARDLD